ncbi:unnamed protein product [Cochlearia groenlandica]
MKRSRIQEKKTSPQYSNGIHIPLDLTVNILSKLPVKSLVRFQCVSNLWSSLILDSMIITPTRSNPRRLPLFIFPHWLLNSSTCSSTNYTRITNHATFISATKERFALANGVISSDDFEYEYTRGLLCSGKLIEEEEDDDSEDIDDDEDVDDESDFSDDPLAEVDLDNILSSRTRRRSSQPGLFISNNNNNNNA